MDVQVREAREDELDEIGALTAEVYEEFVGPDYLAVLRDARSRWQAPATTTFVALDGGTDGLPGRQLLGAVVYAGPGSPWRDIADGEQEAEFRMLGVLESARGRGVGEALVQACVQRARAEGRARLVLSTAPELKAAHRLYERLGFTRAEHRDWMPTSQISLLAYELGLV
ncbi:MAG TPA: GNAT family N-acetyltransferase [Actinocrinis sp.]|jgi:ribosomal protein S18 acetylase RimI-like enzyme|uniref:GNAT family N-acetyltransferase n=1 Tax=Actinocrinis sp. TaxID=1920516 RepID=UPI002DDD1CC0|nr:GNAT family N-acetyltransferase [Actinocrinis sp.]HEV3173191.1 GNAT family N-acetyltransferase [Actinocrinis sp.]